MSFFMFRLSCFVSFFPDVKVKGSIKNLHYTVNSLLFCSIPHWYNSNAHLISQNTYKDFLALVHSIWPVMTEKLFSLPLTKVDIHFGHVRMYATPYPISWIIFISDSEPSYTDKLLEFRWVQIAPLS